eukprot:TRINITY_DN6781_c0_g1_i1.p1 TRINITY_DN6781_c0_g1~~TRINITY_DN6781_c0_g1_i1.p1  ORF type:complete len:296 (-),score=47.71 TRINITY_DN6781_c0_g1_i1:66-953(-)
MSFGGKREVPAPIQFFGGAFGGMVASAATHPLDLAKVLMQVTDKEGKQGFFRTCSTVYRNQGLKGLYQGLSASLLRQCTYTMTRVGLYGLLRTRFQQKDGSLPLWQKIVVSMAAGAGGAIVGTPADVTLVRMQADSKKPIEKRRNYKNAINGLIRIAKEEGFLQMWSGCWPNVYRAMLMSAGQLASYDQAKGTLLEAGMKDGILLHTLASGFAGFVATVITNPLDVIKTRIMNSEKGTYKGSMDCFTKTLRSEGPFAFYKGFLPFYVRLGPHTMITLVVLEQFNSLVFALGIANE